MKRSFSLLPVALLSASFAPAIAFAAPASMQQSQELAQTTASQVPGAPSIEARWRQPLAGDEKILNALNRLTFGPRPGDVAAIKKMGYDRWLQLQLDPAQIDDDALENELQSLSMLNATPETLMLAYSVQNGNARRALEQMNRQQKGVAAAPNVKEVAINARDQRNIEAFQASGMEIGASQQALGELMAAKLARAVD